MNDTGPPIIDSEFAARSPMRLLRPIYESDELATKLLEHLKISYEKPSSKEKARIVAASFCYAAKRIQESNDGTNKCTALGWPHTPSHWTKYPAVGHKIIEDIREALVKAKLIEIIPETGKTIFDENGKFQDKITTLYSVNSKLYSDFDVLTAFYSDKHKISVKVAKYENYGQRSERKRNKRSSPKMTNAACSKAFKGDWGKVKVRIEKLNEFYSENPLTLVDGFQCSAVTRVFSEGRLNAGGRMYGAYSDLGSDDRLKATIKGNPVCEIDIRASQPTLLSCLLGYKLGDTWEDIYSTVPSVVNAKDPDEKKRIREEIKLVIAELIGVGNEAKRYASKELASKGIDEFLFLTYRDEALQAIPALSEMKEKGITSNGYLTYHESEIILRAIETLIKAGIPAYSIHDAIIVESNQSDKGTEALREAWASHCGDNHQAQKYFTTYPALKITHYDMSEQTLTGMYSD